MSTLSPNARRALLERVARTHRFPDFVAQIAAMVELPLIEVEALLLQIDRPESWEQGPLPGISLLHFAGGPSMQNAITGFVRLDVHTAFPQHEHLGHERVLVLQGALRDCDGTHYARGAEIAMAAGTAHAFAAIGEVPLVYLVVVHEGVVIGGQRIGPRDPRG